MKISNGNITNIRVLLYFVKTCENAKDSHIFQQQITVYLLLKLLYGLQFEGLTTALS